MNTKDTRPLIAVIETSNERLFDGQMPVMTVLKPMNRLVAWLYRRLYKPVPPDHDIIDMAARTIIRSEPIEYVVELDTQLVMTLLGSGKQNGRTVKRDNANIRLVLTPSLDLKAAASLLRSGADVRP